MSESDSINFGDLSTSSQRRRRRSLSPSDHTAIDIINAENDDLHHCESSLSSKRERIKWTLLLGSFMVEGLSSAFDQLSVPEKPIYALMAMLMASSGLIVSIIELYYRVQERNMIIRRLVEDALENFGFFASTWQCIYSIIEYNCIKKKLNNPIKMSVLTLIFLICVAIPRLCSNYRGDQISRRESSMDVSTSSRHGASVCVSNASDNEETEWVDDNAETEWCFTISKSVDEPGMCFTISKSVDGPRELVHVRFRPCAETESSPLKTHQVCLERNGDHSITRVLRQQPWLPLFPARSVDHIVPNYKGQQQSVIATTSGSTLSKKLRANKKRKLKILCSLIPGLPGLWKQPWPVIVEEALNYLEWLEVEVRGLSLLSDLLSRSGSISVSASASGTSPPPS